MNLYALLAVIGVSALLVGCIWWLKGLFAIAWRDGFCTVSVWVIAMFLCGFAALISAEIYLLKML